MLNFSHKAVVAVLAMLGPVAAAAQTKPAPVSRPTAKPAPAARPTTRPAPVVAPAPAATPAPAPATSDEVTGMPAPLPPAAPEAAVELPIGPPVQYVVSFPNAIHHEARVKATFAELPAGQKLTIRMARSSPGRYALHEFIKNVYYTVATDGAGKLLPIERPDPYSWVVQPGSDNLVNLEYTLYGDRTDGTYAGIDQQHAHLNMPATLCYAMGLENRPVEVKFDMPATWKAATQLRPGGEPNAFTAPHLQYLMDSPVSLGEQQVRTWEEGGQSISMAVLHTGTPAELDTYVQNTQKVVHEAAAVFGELPQYDFGRYTFIADYLPQASGDGMEHRNSTSLTSSRSLRGDEALDNLGTVSHEFFHSWNVERLRPKDLEPFDFQRTNMSSALWLAEGFTQYYGELVLRRAGIYSDAQFLDRVGSWVNARLNTPGARYASAADMSRQAPFVDAATSIDPTNRPNTYLSYYYQGAGLALVLDLQLREQYKSSLDRYMQALWQQFGKKQNNYAPAAPYTLRDLQRVLGEVSRDTAYAGRFFRQYIDGHEQPRFAEALATAGLAVVPTRSLGTYLNRQVKFEGDRCIVSVNTAIGSGLYKAGIDRGDQLVSLDGRDLHTEGNLNDVLRKHSPNDLVAAKIRTRGGQERSLQLVLNEDPYISVQPVESIGKAADAKQKDLRTNWLASKAK